jgi:predicted phosphodiesterase
MRYAILSDIHSNWEALETAVSYAQGQKIDSWVVLGDTVGYGANPNECFEWAIQNAAIYVTGNHERAVIDPRLREWFNEWAREAIEWTDKVMDPKLKEKIKPLPYVQMREGFTFVHGSLNEPEQFHYLFSMEDAAPTFKQMESPICFIGHTHVPSCFCEKPQAAIYLKPGIWQLEKGERYILNPGSVGQPRDQDPRLAFGIFDTEKQTFQIVRLTYENHKAADKIRKAGLPAYLADRLL